jgi:voltage-gated potassium channel
MTRKKHPSFSPHRERLHEIIFESDTIAGKVFDVALLFAILISVVALMMESVQDIKIKYGHILQIIEWILTLLFTIEYILRLYAVYRPLNYAFSFFGVIDLLSLLPTYLSLFFAGSHYLMAIRALRLLRIFRVFELTQFLRESDNILKALRASRHKIFVFLVFILLCVIIIGATMFLIEGSIADTGFTSIPRSIYWAIVTITTVGYGDIAPQTEIGQLLAALVMILGYAVIAVPTGIISTEFLRGTDEQKKQKALLVSSQSCKYCVKEGHDSDALYCKYCGEQLNI